MLHKQTSRNNHALGTNLARVAIFTNWREYKCKLFEKLPPRLHGNFHPTTHRVTAQPHSYRRSAQILLVSKLQFSFKSLGEELILHICASGEMAAVPG